VKKRRKKMKDGGKQIVDMKNGSRSHSPHLTSADEYPDDEYLDMSKSSSLKQKDTC